MGSLVIVAVPAEDDPIWDISSEKVPHVTLLYLGETDTDQDVSAILEFLQHAVDTTLTRFSLDVDRRGTLGPDQADVVFFEEGWGIPTLRSFRSNLLKNDAIRKAYDAVEQYPEWTPHLTLGYPETPAKPVPRDHRVSWIRFDKIALWTGDSEGPEIPLKNEYDMEVSMSERVDNLLAHYGVKGMRWGVRRKNIGTPSEVTVSTTTSRMAKTKIKTKGGEAQPAHPDAVAARTAGQKLKKSGTNALSNKELQDLALRLNLEQQVNRLSANQESAGKKAVTAILGSVGKQQATKLANEAAAKQVEGLLKRK